MSKNTKIRFARSVTNKYGAVTIVRNIGALFPTQKGWGSANHNVPAGAIVPTREGWRTIERHTFVMYVPDDSPGGWAVGWVIADRQHVEIFESPADALRIFAEFVERISLWDRNDDDEAAAIKRAALDVADQAHKDAAAAASHDWYTTVSVGVWPTGPRGPWHGREAAGEALDRWRRRVGGMAGTYEAASNLTIVGPFCTRVDANDADISDYRTCACE